MLAIWSLVPLPFLNPDCKLGHVLLKPRLENFELYLASMWNECNCAVVWTFFGFAFLGDWNENWPFPVLWPLLSFPNLLAYWVQHFHSIIFWIWNSSAGTPSPLLALFVVILPKAHLTSPSCISGSRWVTTPLWLSESLKPFLYSSSVYSCYLFLISSASVRFLLFLSFTMPILAWNIPLISPVFLKRFIVFLTLLLSSISLIVHFRRLLYLSLLFSGTLHSVGYIFAFLLCLLLLFFPQLFVRLPQTTTLPSCLTPSLRWFWSLPPIQCYKPPSIVLPALCQI